MAAEFGKLPCKVLWRLSNKEIPDEDSIAELGLADNTKVGCVLGCLQGRLSMRSLQTSADECTGLSVHIH